MSLVGEGSSCMDSYFVDWVQLNYIWDMDSNFEEAHMKSTDEYVDPEILGFLRHTQKTPLCPKALSAYWWAGGSRRMQEK